MRCLILAAGYATRLYPLTENFPKPLLKVKGKAIIDWLIEDIDACTVIEEYLVVTNHKYASFFEDWATTKKQKITIVDDGTTTNETRLGAVKDMRLALQGNTQDVLILAGDNLLNFSLAGFVQFFQKKKAPCVMTYEENDPLRQKKTAIISFDKNGLVTSYEEKPKEPKGNHAVPAFYLYRKEDIDRIDKALKEGCGFDTPGSFAAWLSKNENEYAYIMPGKRFDIGDIESYQKAQDEYQGIQ